MNEKKTGKQLRAEFEFLLAKYHNLTNLLTAIVLIATVLASISIAYITQLPDSGQRILNLIIYLLGVAVTVYFINKSYVKHKNNLENQITKIIEKM